MARKWQNEWRRSRVFEADPQPGRKKFFITAAFPYPNSPLHLGHSRTYTITDAYARFKRMQGYNVLFPMGFHYTGTPILTMAESIAAGDKELIDLMINVYDVPPEDIEKLKDPLSLARYFHNDAKQAMMEIGYSIDWRREFTSIDEEFKQFVVWQFMKLKEKGLLKKGTHPVGWCPKHNMPVGMHDTKGDVEPEIGEFTLILFKLENEDVYLPAATLRPETVFGVTNIWLNPEAEYVLVEVDGRKYIMSKRAVFKLRFQRDNVREVREIDPGELFGKRVVNPATGRRVPILPAKFVDPATATGVVMSVPAHAPYDYVALRELLENKELLEKYGVNSEELTPIPLIEVKGYSELPARDVVERMGIRSQYERDLLDKATKELYSDEYRYGVMRSDIVELVYPEAPSELRDLVRAAVKAWIVGQPVSVAREATVKWLSAIGRADKIYEIMNRPVYCRCGTEIVVKVLKDQWFVDYGNPEWKRIVLEHLEVMRIVPEELREEFRKVVDWLRERAVARTRGLGTELPWAKGWIIESLSDSTIYMAFYTVIHKIRSYGLKPDQLTLEFWDYVMLGKGDPKAISAKIGVPVKVLEELRSEFEYWYPLDSRHSGRDLVPNHLTFFIFNHVAIFPRDKWPRQIVVNGFVMLEGKKMSKSLRNIIPLRRALRIYGPDTVRAAILAAAELLQDADFSDALARSVMGQLAKFESIAAKALEHDDRVDLVDRWLLSKLQESIEYVTKAMEELRVRSATIHVLYEMENMASKYLELRGGKPGPALLEYVKTWTKMLAPVAPHLAEEVWHRLGGESFVSIEKWPSSDKTKIDYEAELAIEYLDKVIEDVKSILRIFKGKPRRLIIAVAGREYWSYARIAAEVLLARQQLRTLIQRFVEAGISDRKQAAQLAQKISRVFSELSPETLKRISMVEEFDEKAVLEKFKDYVASRLGMEEVVIVTAEEAEHKELVPPTKLAQAVPMRPAILVE
nr:leucine--tRNA ligase [Hyperthermus butylicus]